MLKQIQITEEEALLLVRVGRFLSSGAEINPSDGVLMYHIGSKLRSLFDDGVKSIIVETIEEKLKEKE